MVEAAGIGAGAVEVGQVQQGFCHPASPQGLVEATPSQFTLDPRASAVGAFSQRVLGLFCSV